MSASNLAKSLEIGCGGAEIRILGVWLDRIFVSSRDANGYDAAPLIGSKRRGGGVCSRLFPDTKFISSSCSSHPAWIDSLKFKTPQSFWGGNDAIRDRRATVWDMCRVRAHGQNNMTKNSAHIPIGVPVAGVQKAAIRTFTVERGRKKRAYVHDHRG